MLNALPSEIINVFDVTITIVDYKILKRYMYLIVSEFLLKDTNFEFNINIIMAMGTLKMKNRKYIFQMKTSILKVLD